ncbi:hypothetical protein Cs7R123_45240 [Catellatospora sp. TT07R-123]|uniref:SdpA family antimicrobial peptide system protein n=1 Tax=Catellatospora sp. TT07R-123 TaxID=2733863 RepID=UPI001B1E94C6|nr:SdpA family antimicrobial peptide system protein [Catellatospora sp. TT07R-123]GHJ47182.1 hypothetical protein Cs7R123_45240 [Catellatospora sp. TT07R-123]
MSDRSAVLQHRTTRDAGAEGDGAGAEHDGRDDGLGSAPPPASEHEDLRLGRRVATVAVLAMILAGYVLHAALPATAFKLPFYDKQVIRSLMPEGWAFFTKSPKDPEATVYGLGPGGAWHSLNAGPQANVENLMGLDRLARSQGTEMALVLRQVPSDDWSACRRTPIECLSELSPQHTVINFSTHRTICGDVGVAIQEVLPWAWHDLPTVMPSKVVRVRVTC